MPEQVKRPNPWKKMMIMTLHYIIVVSLYLTPKYVYFVFHLANLSSGEKSVAKHETRNTKHRCVKREHSPCKLLLFSDATCNHH